MDQKDEVKSKVDLVEVVSSYLPLKKAGRNFAGLCPFHTEKTPSFMVSAERQVFKCFGCFPKGALIKTPAGLHPIESIKVGDYVISGKGRSRRVLRTHKRYFQGRLIEVIPRKLAYPTSLTEDHQVFTLRTAPYLRKYKNLSRRLRSYDGLSSEKLRYKLNKYFSINKVYAGELSLDNYLLYPIKQEIKRIESIDLLGYLTLNPKRGKSPRLFPIKVLLNKDFLKLLGYYLAEGSSHRAYIRFSLGGHEIKLAEEVTRLIKSVFNLDSSIHFRKAKKTGIEVTCCNSFLANIFENMCGKGAANKHIDYLLEMVDPKAQKVIVEAILRGDGTTRFVKKSPNVSYSITTISEVLAEQIVDILLRNEIFPGVGVTKERIDKKGVNHKKVYRITWYEKKEENYSMVYKDRDGTRYWILPIRKIEERPFKGVVYNFSVSEDHSYVANNFAVGNCGEGGDVFTFLEKVEGWDFREALEELANKVGVKLTKFAPSGKSQQKERLVEINNLVSRFYSYILEKHALGENARRYLKKRGILEKTWKKFGVGFAPVGWENTFKFLMKHKFSAADIASAGLIVAKQRRAGQQYFDRFRNRLMFPLCDSRGTILGFAGRLIEEGSRGQAFGSEAQARRGLGSSGEAKYINSPETPIFNKGSLLFGLDLARKSIRGQNEAVLVEGEFDVMSASQIGVENVVASKGTALTEKQVVALSRLCENVVLSFDEDVAGDAAARRGIELLDVAGMQVKVVRLGKHKDPDEFSQKDASGFKGAVLRAQNIYDYFIESAQNRFDAKSSEGKKKIGREILPIIASISDDLVRAHYIDKLARVLELDVNLIAGAVEKKMVSTFAPNEIINSQKSAKSLDIEKYFLALFFFQDEIHKQALNFAAPKDFESTEAEDFWKWLRDIIVTLNSPTVKKVIKRVPARFKDFVDDLYLVNISPVFADREIWAGELAKIANRIKKASIKRKLVEISEEIKSAEKKKEFKRIESLTKKFDEMSKNLKEKSL